MKNILLFIIDSLNYSYVKHSSLELMPFLKELEQKGISCENMFSQAPYTEAAVMNIYCGQNVLSNGGYINRFKDAPLTIFEAMQKKGYVTYFNSMQPQCYPSSLRRGVDHLYYNVGYDLGALWSYRLAHYSAIQKKGEMRDWDYSTLIGIIEDNLLEWLRVSNEIACGNSTVEMIKDNAKGYDACAVAKAVTSEYETFLKDKKAYVIRLLEEGKAHSLYSIPAFVQNNKIKNRDKMDEIREVVMPVLKRVRRMNRRLNLRNEKNILKGPFRKFGSFLNHPSKTSFKDCLKSGYLSYNALFDSDLYERIKGDYDLFKNAPSARTHIDHYLRWAKEKASVTPHFACIHIDDIHNPEQFFTYDSDDIGLIKHEMEDAIALLDTIPKDHHGSISHALSLRYMDGVIRYMYERLESEGLLEDTVVAICADHGFSFSGVPLRDSFVINLFLENYNIPFVITGAGHEGLRLKDLRSSKDIAATLCSIADGNIPDKFDGRSVIANEGYPHISIEYCGGGCPDLTRRELKMAAFDNQWFVGVLATVDQDIDAHTLTEIYNLVNDPQQVKNLVKGKYDENAVAPLIKALRERKDQIRRDTNQFAKAVQ